MDMSTTVALLSVAFAAEVLTGQRIYTCLQGKSPRRSQTEVPLPLSKHPFMLWIPSVS